MLLQCGDETCKLFKKYAENLCYPNQQISKSYDKIKCNEATRKSMINTFALDFIKRTNKTHDIVI